ncbi:hypothetical protein DITRI_Ditri11bG0098700 [Diplodiscus trichospermus]
MQNRLSKSKQVLEVRWDLPIRLRHKLNTDGVVNTRTGAATAGGVIRDHHGNWIKGFTMHIGLCDVKEAKL